MTEHKTGYHVWIFGARHWHRTLEGAQRRYDGARKWADGQRQIIEVRTGDLIGGARG